MKALPDVIYQVDYDQAGEKIVLLFQSDAFNFLREPE